MPLVSPREIAAHLGVTPQRVSQLVHQGMPREAFGKYDLEACLEWAKKARPDRPIDGEVAGASELTHERVLLTRVQREAAEFNLACSRNEWVENEAVLTALGHVVEQVILQLDTWVDTAPNPETMELRRETAWRCRTVIGDCVEGVCADSAGVSLDQAAGLRNTRQLR